MIMNRLHLGLSVALFLISFVRILPANDNSAASMCLCPFCSAVSQTFSEEMASMDVAVFARLTKAAETPDEVPDPSDVVRAQFTVVDVLKGIDFVSKGDTFETVYFGEAGKEDLFLVQGIRPPTINWTTPLRLTDRSENYLRLLGDLPAGGPKRLEFFQKHLEDQEEMLARDAYDEFAKAPYDDVRGLKDKMNHDQLVKWLSDPDIPASRKRLYFTMLGVCGSTQDLGMLEGLMKSTDRRQKAGLDAMIACYLTLSGPDGMGMIEDLFLKNQSADYSDTYAAIAALRFHGTEADIIPQKRIVVGLGYMLDRPELADLVIPDLARWEDWTVMDRLVKLFKTADEKTSWVRVPVINYLRACPLPEAKKHLAELEKIDPDAVRRASTFFPVLDDEDDSDDASEPESEADGDSEEGDGDSVSGISNENVQTVERIAMLPTLALTTSMLTSSGENEASNQSEPAFVGSSQEPAGSPNFAPISPVTTPIRETADSGDVADATLASQGSTTLLGQSSTTSSLVLVLAMLLLGAIIFGVQWSILTGQVVRFFN